MRRRLRIAAAVMLLLATAVAARAQIHVTGGFRPQPSAAPPARPAQPSPNQPARPVSPVPFGSVRGIGPSMRPPYAHRPLPIRSSYFGLLMFDPYWWLDSGTVDDAPPGAFAAGPRPMGGLQLDVEPRAALAYVDGFLVGAVENYSGYFQHLELPAGTHLVEFVAPGYEPLRFEIVVTPDRTTTFRMTLNRAWD